ncbi:MAG: mannose-6-phosphate isomerase, class I [Brevibacillus sp.]|nr:mannose-6-phosphate isomerase, class I [Brevibacillus sp.]
MSSTPLFLKPVLQERLWGGEALKRFGYSFSSSNVGECWAVSAHPHGESIVMNGLYAGWPLSRLWAEHPELFGYPAEDQFPLLIKLIDANADLSVQVHPDDYLAQQWEGQRYGKTECWYVLDCKPQSRIIYGHNASTREELKHMTVQGAWSTLLRTKPVKPGDIVYVPSGTVHALTKGTLVLEVQQSSDLTYRFYDYDRTDADGRRRELHLDKAVQAASVPHVDVWYSRNIIQNQDYTCETLIHHQHFLVQVWDIRGEASLGSLAPYGLITVLSGQGLIGKEGNAERIGAGMSLLVPNGYGDVVITGELRMVVTTPGSHRKTDADYRIGVDIGGTNLRAAVIDQSGHIVKKLSMKTFADKGPDFVIHNLASMLRDLTAEYSVSHIGIACPGPLDAAEGIIMGPPNLPGWDQIHLRAILTEQFQLPIKIENDANAAALCEALFGAGKGRKSVFYITISTGIGGGFVYNQSIVQGAHFCAGEIGNMIIQPDGPAHPILNRGSWETLASGTALNDQARQLDLEKTLFQLEQEGNPQAKALVEQFIRHTATGIANIVHLLDPDTIILGGGVMHASHLFWERLNKAVNDRLYPQLRNRIDLQLAQFHDDAGLIGAAFL